MPISAEMWKRYPPDWDEISHRIRFERAEGRCKCDGICGYDHDGRCTARHGETHPVSGNVVVLTTAHLNHVPEESGDDNLRAMCARCHLAHDREHHQGNARVTRSVKRIAALGNAELFPEMGVRR